MGVPSKDRILLERYIEGHRARCDVEQLAYRILHDDLHMDPRAAEMAKAKVAKTIRSRMVVARKDNPPTWTILLEIHVDCMIEKSDEKEGEPSGEHGYDRLLEWLDDGDCPICCNEFSSTDDIVVTTCHHTYHRSCLFKWLGPGTSS
ncbi:hypothetical protein EJ110_NYTH52994 [Nymphaea thermarum]|nr:hypothetical protein EJ110_NYTH52994 [Nymphaea thermarum]